MRLRSGQTGEVELLMSRYWVTIVRDEYAFLRTCKLERRICVAVQSPESVRITAETDLDGFPGSALSHRGAEVENTLGGLTES